MYPIIVIGVIGLLRPDEGCITGKQRIAAVVQLSGNVTDGRERINRTGVFADGMVQGGKMNFPQQRKNVIAAVAVPLAHGDEETGERFDELFVLIHFHFLLYLRRLFYFLRFRSSTIYPLITEAWWMILI